MGSLYTSGARTQKRIKPFDFTKKLHDLLHMLGLAQKCSTFGSRKELRAICGKGDDL